MTSGHTTAAILTRFLPQYRQHHVLSPQQAKVAGLVCRCRTDALGSVALTCPRCQHQQTCHRSCRNRHCPQCQRQGSAAWLAARCDDLLPVPYFHVVFTLPHALNGWAQRHPEVIYRLLFHVVWQTLASFGRDPKRLSGQLGMTAVLHTWGQNLSQHIHLHCLIPGGAYDRQREQWHPAKSTYLFPVKALSRHYRGAMVSALRQAYRAGELPGITQPDDVDSTLKTLMATDWVVYSRATCTQSTTVLAYLARYTHRIALSDSRIREVTDRDVSFVYKRYAQGGSLEEMRLAGDEFVRRWLLHVLPHGFMRIRHYGFLANACRRKHLGRIRQCLNKTRTNNGHDRPVPASSLPAQVIHRRWPPQCPCCGLCALQIAPVSDSPLGRTALR
ncbi:MAG: IS91 family transposase [Porticoccaceae bacterium]|nr:IS91 family transposase [Porticoccaceae bacterium]